MAINKIGPKKLIDIIRSQCLYDTLNATIFPSVMFATEKDEEKANVTSALYYLKKNWKEAANKGMKVLRKEMKRVRKERNNNEICE